MSIVCEICGKKKVTGSSQQHGRGVAGKRWLKRAQKTKRVFYPNLQMRTFEINGEEKKMKVCAKCLKAAKNFKSVGKYKNIIVK
jgi:large subunit ribosomal protein L28